MKKSTFVYSPFEVISMKIDSFLQSLIRFFKRTKTLSRTGKMFTNDFEGLIQFETSRGFSVLKLNIFDAVYYVVNSTIAINTNNIRVKSH